ncbi:family 43 glycosylhydrolase [Endozoicomonas sp. SCSIO W0465]|uniref:family 43 glycosylhydrolase n=1 Tax=Endozoicomonas sp. SCSIO W0465 TaxID=2918516 RepID=UPI00207562A7|nr:family 43 glycosylhydrolase [Endozoicomonas sp. SCSIO W0465]USE38852.1 family 43 glycosylhydrolase [Endozoicomonas sp. SCSIO W0465]
MTLALLASSAIADLKPIESGKDWLDTRGKLINAHGGTLFQAQDTYYWIGQDRTKNTNLFNALNCYSSTDLTTWTFENQVMTSKRNTELPSDVIIARPKVIYNPLTDSFVMWFKYRRPGGIEPNMRAGVASSHTPCGDYNVESVFFPTADRVAHYAGDNALYADENGKGYYVLSSIGELKDGEMGTLAEGKIMRRLKIFELTPDFRNIEKLVYEFPVEAVHKEQREAPGIVKMGDTYVLFSSGTMAWRPNQQQYSTAPAMTGPWSPWKNIGDETAYDSQTAFLIPVVGDKQTTYIYAADRHEADKLIDSR